MKYLLLLISGIAYANVGVSYERVQAAREYCDNRKLEFRVQLTSANTVQKMYCVDRLLTGTEQPVVYDITYTRFDDEKAPGEFVTPAPARRKR